MFVSNSWKFDGPTPIAFCIKINDWQEPWQESLVHQYECKVSNMENPAFQSRGKNHVKVNSKSVLKIVLQGYFNLLLRLRVMSLMQQSSIPKQLLQIKNNFFAFVHDIFL